MAALNAEQDRKVQREIKDILRYITKKYDYKALESYIETAGDWYSGMDSIMRHFWVNCGYLDSYEEYGLLRIEIEECLRELMPNTEIDRPRLQSLYDFASQMYKIGTTLKEIAKHGAQLKKLNVPQGFVTSVINAIYYY